MRLVLDTNVVASALLWGGVPRQLLQAGRTQRVDLFTSPPLLAELADILARREQQRSFRDLPYPPRRRPALATLFG